MLKVSRKPIFLKKISKIRDSSLKEKVKKQVKKIVEDPLVGKPMRYKRKGTRELYIKPFRISYAYLGDTVIFLDIYHKDCQ